MNMVITPAITLVARHPGPSEKQPEIMGSTRSAGRMANHA